MNFLTVLQEKVNKKEFENEDGQVLRFLQGLKQQKVKFLDLGCGLGRFISVLKRDAVAHKIEIFGADINKNLIDYVDLKDNRKFVCDAVATGFRNEYFDIVQASHLVEHFAYPQVTLFLDEIFRIVKVGGYVVIRTPLMHPGFYNDIDHVRPYPIKSIINYFNLKQQQKVGSFKIKLASIWYRRESMKTESMLDWPLKLSWLMFGWPCAKANGYVAILKKI